MLASCCALYIMHTSNGNVTSQQKMRTSQKTFDKVQNIIYNARHQNPHVADCSVICNKNIAYGY